MELNISERIALLNILPIKGDILTLRIIQELRMNAGFTESEIKRWRMKNRTLQGGGSVITWDEDFTNEVKELEIGDAAKGIIQETLKKLNEQKELHVSMLSLYEKFVEGKV